MNRSTLNILLPQLYNCRAKWSAETYELYRTKVGFIKIKNLLVCRSCHLCCSLLIVASGVLNPHAGISTALVLAQGGARQLSLQSEIDMLLKFHLPNCFCVNCFPILAVFSCCFLIASACSPAVLEGSSPCPMFSSIHGLPGLVNYEGCAALSVMPLNNYS